MLGHSLPIKIRKRLAPDIFGIIAAHSGLVHDDTDTDCLAQNGTLTGVFSPH